MLKEPWGVQGHPHHAATIPLTLAWIQYDQSQGALTSWVSRVSEKRNLKPPVGGKWAKTCAFRPTPAINRLYGRASSLRNRHVDRQDSFVYGEPAYDE